MIGFDRVGHDGLARMVATIRDALDEYHCEIHSMVVENNKAFVRLRFTGKHIGRLLGYIPTNRTVSWMGATEFTCQNNKILKVWELGDVKSLEEQLRQQCKTTTTSSTTGSINTTTATSCSENQSDSVSHKQQQQQHHQSISSSSETDIEGDEDEVIFATPNKNSTTAIGVHSKLK
jgi:predicted ester cyclase